MLPILLALSDCSPRTGKLSATYNGLPVVDLCDLPNYRNMKVMLRANYAGVEEYWSLGSQKNKKCNNDLKVNLEYVVNYEVPNGFQKEMTQAINNYWSQYLELEAIGTYETGQIGGYGHLGTNNSRFLVNELIKVKAVKVKN
ncbi:hypothetical protein [Dyadobacter sp. CY343]|uniref:hypothetical protein n=1 Tax=Dyadobacter sp. CY343 TaxID=2907299 RepID=UPI001F30A6A3|nr:hypothetical protein [Dyadobacter sp. CY343]MCE7061978.1 hypothetical protein [Dyadobacter sp. CY343]